MTRHNDDTTETFSCLMLLLLLFGIAMVLFFLFAPLYTYPI